MNENTDQTTPLNQTNQYYRIFKDETELDGLREQVLSSRYRQTYHIQPVAGLMNDPNGFLYHHGNWHLFYQWCPWGAVHGLKHWYHTVSTDLVHWKNMGLAIAPDREYENEGAFSGTSITEDDGIRIYYAGNQRDKEGKLVPNVCMAKLFDDGHLEKSEHELIPPHPDYTHDQRDPQVICVQEGTEDRYYILMGARSKDDRGCLLLYTSDQRTTGWQFVGQVKVPGYENFGSVWECPSIIRLREVDLLIFCPQNILLPGRGQAPHHNVYLLGHMDYQNCIFQPRGSYQFLDYGYDFYAAQCAAGTASDAQAVMSAWMGLPAAAYPTDSENWSGCLTIPRELTIENGALIQRPPAA
ncbi:MAG: glycoside hydrolase family 32 protein, partial [Lachnospiraceae bacterium]|nr:glycoside hydrolase family 32 protein [Lachnospiraceae bacterium]